MKPDKAAVRGELAASLPFMGTPRDRAGLVGKSSLLRDAKLWHALSRSGGTKSFPPEECAAWAILYRAAFYGRLPKSDLPLCRPRTGATSNPERSS